MKIKKTTLQKSLFKKYIVGFIIFQVISQVVIGIGLKIIKDISAVNIYSTEDVYEKIDKHGIEKAFLYRKLPQNTYIEILDLNYRVKSSMGSSHNIGYVYNIGEINDIANGKRENTGLFFLKKTQEILIVKEQPVNKQSTIYAIGIIIFLLLIMLMYIFFFKIMAKKVSSMLQQPLEKLMGGVNAFKNKIYSYRITFNAGNELDDLKDAFNDMADTIEKEMNLRKAAQDMNKQLILDITHDLKTPLTNIEGYSELLKGNESLDDNARKQYLDIIISNSRRINKLITDLFDLTYCEMKYGKLERKKTDFSELVRRLLIEYVAIFESKGNKYEFDIPEAPLWVCIDIKMVERAICNIINNFLKYSGEESEIHVTLNENEHEAELVIEDNGIGIPRDKCEKIFEPFVAQDSSRDTQRGGTGLGLAIAKKVFEGHGGSIKLISDIDKGCKFVIKMEKHP